MEVELETTGSNKDISNNNINRKSSVVPFLCVTTVCNAFAVCVYPNDYYQGKKALERAGSSEKCAENRPPSLDSDQSTQEIME